MKTQFHPATILRLLILLSMVLPLGATEKLMWETVTSRFTEASLLPCDGCAGDGVSAAINFPQGSGYAGIRTQWPLNLEGNFQFSFYVKSDLPVNNLEIKLLDASGDNVWWQIHRNYDFPEEWQRIVVKKNRIEFAWGPTTDRTLRSMAQMEIMVSSVNGGKGTLSIDRMEFTELPKPPAVLLPTKVQASSQQNRRFSAEKLLDGDPVTVWRSKSAAKHTVILDAGAWKEFGALLIHWAAMDAPVTYRVFRSLDGNRWDDAGEGRNFRPGLEVLSLIDEEGRYLKLEISPENGRGQVAIGELILRDAKEVPDKFALWKELAGTLPKGFFPRYFYGEQNYWTITGAPDDDLEILLGEEGQIEIDKRSLTMEPFLYVNDKLLTWNDAQQTQSLENHYLPFPSVTSDFGELTLTTAPFVWKYGGETLTMTEYTLANTGNAPQSGDFFLTLRPFQVNSPWQFLNNPGGLARIETLTMTQTQAVADGQIRIRALSPAQDWGVSSYQQGEIITYIHEGKLPAEKTVSDPDHSASGAWRHPFALAPGETVVFRIVTDRQIAGDTAFTEALVLQLRNDARLWWKDKLNAVSVRFPGEFRRLSEIVKANLAYILINRDGLGIQPGSRSYERSWIRDGSLTSSALLKFGITEESREFTEWYAPFQAPDGYVPCVVDRRGPDPVAEHDSHGQLIFAIAEYVRFTQDTLFLRTHWPYVTKAVSQMENLTASRRTELYLTGDSIQQACYGLLPESISHEGYSAKPMHSYWDNFFALRGYKDAVWLAETMGYADTAALYRTYETRFSNNLYASIEKTMRNHSIEYLPGCAELGDFDATSTAIAVLPVGELSRLPEKALKATFDRYYEYFWKRSKNESDWKDYTPYEVRVLGTMIALNQMDLMVSMLDFFFNDQRPQGWRHWAEVVRNGTRTPGFIGDMPHTWVGSDFINAVRAMLVIEDEAAHTLVLAAGIPEAWAMHPEGVSFQSLPTYYGNLTGDFRANGDLLTLTLHPLRENPAGGVLIRNIKLQDNVKAFDAEGTPLPLERIPRGYLHFSSLPEKVIWSRQ